MDIQHELADYLKARGMEDQFLWWIQWLHSYQYKKETATGKKSPSLYILSQSVYQLQRHQGLSQDFASNSKFLIFNLKIVFPKMNGQYLSAIYVSNYFDQSAKSPGSSGTDISFRTTFPCRASSYWFYLTCIISGLPEISYNICQNVIICHVLFLMDLMIIKPFSKFYCIVSIFLSICAIFLHKKMCSAQKISLPITNMYLPERPFIKNSLAGASGLVLQLVFTICKIITDLK